MKVLFALPTNTITAMVKGQKCKNDIEDERLSVVEAVTGETLAYELCVGSHCFFYLASLAEKMMTDAFHQLIVAAVKTVVNAARAQAYA